MGSPVIRREWEGLVVNGTFALLEWLGGSEDHGVFLTMRQGAHRAAIKLIVAEGADADEYLAQWKAARELSHPFLTPVLEFGRCAVASADLVYVVTELAQGSLSKTIQERAIRADEVKEFFDPVLVALSFLHGKGFVHGHVKPSNILFFANAVKLSGDDFLVHDGVAKSVWEPSAYDAPEVSSDTLTEAVDSWSVGITLVEAITQHLPARAAEEGGPVVPESLPAPFYEIAQECFQFEPEQRCTIRNIRARLQRDELLKAANEAVVAKETRLPVAEDAVKEGQIPIAPKQEAAKAEPVPVAAEEDEIVDEPIPAAARPQFHREYDEEAPILFLRAGLEDTYLTKRPKWPIALGVVALVAVAAVLLVRGDAYKRILPFLTQSWRAVSQGKTQPQPPAVPTASPAANDAVAPPTTSPPVPSPEKTESTPASDEGEARTQPPVASPSKAQSTPLNDETAPSSSSLPAASPGETQSTPAARQGESHPETPASRASRSGSADGEVASRVLPNVSQFAISSMRRPVEVVVRVSVNRSGGVSNADYVSPGPGNYFARVSQEAAKSWKFEPPTHNGDPQPSVWMLQFYFWRSEIKASAVEMGR